MDETESRPKKRNIVPKKIWEAIQRGLASGLTLEELEAKYCVKQAHIDTVATKKRWPRPRKLIDEAVRQGKFEAEMAVSEQTPAAPPAEFDWAEQAVNYRKLMFGKVREAALSLNLESPKTWRDAEIMDRIGRKAVGLESGETTVVNTIIPIGKGDFNVERDVTPAQKE